MKEYKLTDKLQSIWCKYMTYLDLRELYVDKSCKHGKAVKCGYKATKFRIMFWSGVHKLYPELENKSLTYSESRNSIKVNDNKTTN
jgi:hypothetical protein